MTAQLRPDTDDASIAQLATRLSEQSSALVKAEIELAKLEISDKISHIAKGAGLFTVSGLLALSGYALTLVTVVLALALVMPAWLAALVVTLVLFAGAGVAALIGRKEAKLATPLTPERTLESVKLDVEEVKEARHRDH